MFDQTETDGPAPAPSTAMKWTRTLSEYREPSEARSWFELGVTLVPFLALWALAWWSLAINPLLTLAISLANAGFLLRLFIIQHDCGHRAFFKNRTLGDWLGRALGVLTLTPYDVWRQSHAIHHSCSGNLARRGMGDVNTLTVDEYRARTPRGRLAYRTYRHPFVLFCLGPAYLFFLTNRLPLGFTASPRAWLSAMGTNAAIAAMIAGIVYFGGWMHVALIFVPTTLLAATAGVWLFYVQHQFEDTHWDHEDDWQLHDAALHGSSHYMLPRVLQWLSGNIGLHHVHHLQSRIPFYRLTEVLRDHTDLAEGNQLTISQSLACVRLTLWDARSRRLISFDEARLA